MLVVVDLVQHDGTSAPLEALHDLLMWRCVFPPSQFVDRLFEKAMEVVAKHCEMVERIVSLPVPRISSRTNAVLVIVTSVAIVVAVPIDLVPCRRVVTEKLFDSAKIVANQFSIVPLPWDPAGLGIPVPTQPLCMRSVVVV